MSDPFPFVLALPAAVIAAIYFLRSIRLVNQWETALKFTLGKLTGRVEPGRSAWSSRGSRSSCKVDTRIRNRDLPYQQVITQDNVTASIDAVIYYKVVDVEKAVLNVENFEAAVWDRARVVLRDVAGETRLDELLTHREQVAAKVRAAVEQFVAQWGLHIELIALKDIQLPPQMQEVIARKAIAERDRQYVIIKSQADLESAKNFAEAARILAELAGRHGAAAPRGAAEPVGAGNEQGDLRPGQAVRRRARRGGYRGGDGDRREAQRPRRQAGGRRARGREEEDDEESAGPARARK